ncbi:MAG: ATP-dependent DNA ligase [Betaproteobacteria bacterium]|nr:ATP-dependent DNA ligase [Betaproteobacteria bacterium]
MKRFARLYEALDATTSTNAKLAALREYFASAPDADAAWAVYFLSGEKPKRVVPTRTLRDLARRLADVPDWLFEESYQAVGDLAETIAHLLPEPVRDSDESLAAWIEGRLLALRDLRDDALETALVAAWDDLDRPSRFLWNKLITGGFRVGVSKQLVTRAVAEVAGLDPNLVAERLMGAWTPTAASYRALRADEHAQERERSGRPYPFFLAHALDRTVEELGPIEDWHAEWKWDGIRVQLVVRGGGVHLWSRGDELITDRFPELADLGTRLPDGTVVDGELLAWRDDRPLPFAALQQRIGRRQLTARVLDAAPAALVGYDLLELAGEDIRARPFEDRRAALAGLVEQVADSRFVLSSAVRAADWAGLAALRGEARARGVEGLMLKRRGSPYGAGRVKLGPGGEWWKWKVDLLSVDAVLVYAQRGHGRRASLYTDYTFAVWRGDELVPFAKAYSGLTDAEIREVDAFIRRNTREKFGPVRSVTPELVMEIGFEGIQRSPRHKSGIAVRFPRILRLRGDKKAADADTLDTLRRLLEAVPA